MPTLRIPVDTQRAREDSGPEPGRTGKITGVLSYTDFFLGSTTVAGALTGLLFVSLSVTSEQLTGSDASAEVQSVAAALGVVFFGVRPARGWGLFGPRGGRRRPMVAVSGA